ncbi:HYR domain-containing protein [Flavobacterium pedocola]
METFIHKKGFWGCFMILLMLLMSIVVFGHDHHPSVKKKISFRKSSASIVSDRPDYQPGDTLRLYGSGWQPGETVQLHFDETPTVCPNGHNRYTVADSNGNVFYNQFYFNTYHLGVAFVVTATGQSSGLMAQTTFTDALEFSASIATNPSGLCSGANASYSVTITNLTVGPPTGNNARAGSIRIAVPAAFTSVSALATSLSSRFAISFSSGNINVSRTGGASNGLGVGESIVISFTANAPVSVSNPYPFTTTAWVGNDFTTTQFPAPTNQPQVNIGSGPSFSVSDITVNNKPGFCYAAVTLGSNISSSDSPLPTFTYSLTNFGSELANPRDYPVGETVVYVKGSNGCGDVIKSFKVTVTDNQAPNAPSLPDVTAQCSVASITAPTAPDNCVGNVTGITSTSFPITTQGETLVTWTFNDGNGNQSQSVQRVYIDDTLAPEAPALDDVLAQCSVASITAPTAPDNCEGNITGITSTVFPITTQGETLVTWTFNDGNGNQSQSVQRVYIDDTIAPEAPALDDVLAQCLVASIDAPTAPDNCEGNITGITTTVFPITTQGETLVTWTFNDGNGNQSQSVQRVFIDDTIAPEAPALDDVLAQCSVASIDAPTAPDNCVGSVTGTTATTFPITTQGETLVTWKFNDGNGNESTAVQRVFIDDTIEPEAPALDDVLAQCSVASIDAPTAPDNCEGNITGITATVFPITTQGETLVTWTFNDGNGNQSQSVQRIYIDDILAPEAPALDDVLAQCSVASITAPTAPDNCEGNITGITATVFPITTQGETLVTWTFNDGNGNQSQSVQRVFIDDTLAPEAPALDDVLAQCSVASITAPTAPDNCEGNITGITTTVFPITTQGETLVTWTFNDGNGNQSQSVQRVYIDDTIAPEAPALDDVLAQCSVASITAPTAPDNCEGNITGITATVFPITTQGETLVTWTFNDGNGNQSQSVQRVYIDDTIAPEAPALDDVLAQCSVASITAPTAPDNCEGNITGITATVFPITTQGETLVTWTFNDGNGNESTAVQRVFIDDTVPPTITCPQNICLKACQATASWSLPTVLDNCSGYQIVQTAGPASGSQFANGTSTTISYSVTDAGGNIANCSFVVTRPAQLAAAVTNTNDELYYGYTGDQSSVFTVTPSGGKAPYAIEITMNRALKCNQVNDSGDESWVGGNGGVTINNSCMAFPSTVSSVPKSTKTIASGSFAVTVNLMADADITATITDADGCVVTTSKHIHADDVRCFAGNSGRAKVTLCHKTGSVKNPCVKICVDDDAVAEHLAHGDFLGNCTPNCQPPVLIKDLDINTLAFDVKAYPNPSNSQFTMIIENGSLEKVSVTVYDVSGRMVKQIKDYDDTVLYFGEDLPRGIYLTVVEQGTNRKTMRLIKE